MAKKITFNRVYLTELFLSDQRSLKPSSVLPPVRAVEWRLSQQKRVSFSNPPVGYRLWAADEYKEV